MTGVVGKFTSTSREKGEEEKNQRKSQGLQCRKSDRVGWDIFLPDFVAGITCAPVPGVVPGVYVDRVFTGI